MDFSRILNKPFLVKTFNWTNVQTAFTTIDTFTFPSGALLNDLVKIPFDSSAVFRAKACVMLQVSGTAMHAGTLIASALPVGTPTSSRFNIGNMMASPHAFLYANEASSVCVEIPFYSNSTLAYCDAKNNVVSGSPFKNDYATIAINVLNPLISPTGAATTVTGSIHVMFTDIEFYGPHIDVAYKTTPQFKSARNIATGFIDGVFSNIATAGGDFLDFVRGTIRQYTGLHNPNTPSVEHKMLSVQRNPPNITDAKTHYEKMDPYTQYDRVVQSPIFHTLVDEMDMKYLLSKPYYLGTCSLNTSDAKGKIMWSRPITPMSENFVSPSFFVNRMSMLDKLGMLSRHWRGSLKIHIQSSMTNFHFAKLIVARNYSPQIDMLTKYPVFESLQNLMVETLEFSAGGQIHTVEMPYLAPTSQLPCERSVIENALQHGIYYIINAQPLVTNGSVGTSVDFNIYISAGDDFQYYGYATESTSHPNEPGSPYNPLTASASALEVQPLMEENSLASDALAFIKAETAFFNQKPLVKVKAQSNIPSQLATGDNLVGPPVKSEPTHYTEDFTPIYSVRDYMRRMYKVSSETFEPGSFDSSFGIVTFDIAREIHHKQAASGEISPLGQILRSFLGYSGGVKFKVVVRGCVDVSVYYIPPGRMCPNGIDYVASQPIPASLCAQYAAVSDAFYAKAAGISDNIFHPTTFIELPNNTSANCAAAVPYAPDRLLSASYCIVEGLVPDYSYYKFVGDSSKLYDEAALPYRGTTMDMGHLVVRVTGQEKLFSNDSHLRSGFSIDLYLGASDEGRAGFQVFSPPMTDEVIVGSTGVLLRSTPYNNSAGLGTFFASPVTRSSFFCPAAYVGS